jgi:hypothetical protein
MDLDPGKHQEKVSLKDHTISWRFIYCLNEIKTQGKLIICNHIFDNIIHFYQKGEFYQPFILTSIMPHSIRKHHNYILRLKLQLIQNKNDSRPQIFRR